MHICDINYHSTGIRSEYFRKIYMHKLIGLCDVNLKFANMLFMLILIYSLYIAQNFFPRQQLDAIFDEKVPCHGIGIGSFSFRNVSLSLHQSFRPKHAWHGLRLLSSTKWYLSPQSIRCMYLYVRNC